MFFYGRKNKMSNTKNLSEGAKEVKDGVGPINDIPSVLIVAKDASHYGYINENFVKYIPEYADENFLTFIKPFPKPVIVNHDDTKKPLGRGIGYAIRPYVSTKETSKDSKDNFEDKKMEEKNDPAIVGMVLERITDKEAIKSIINGEYLTSSVHSTFRGPIICSGCGTDVTGRTKGVKVKDDEDEDQSLKDACTHLRGRTGADGKPIHWEPTKLRYVENSFIINPADQSDKHFAGVIAFAAENDKKERDKILGLAKWIGYKLKDKTLVHLNSETYESVISQLTSTDLSDSMEDLSDEIDIEDIVLPLELSDEFDLSEGTDEEINELFNYIKSWKDFKEENDEEDCKDCLEEEDAVLTTKKRNALRSKTFCGPDRSFPVNDCLHGAVALRLLGRYKGPGDKEKIKACIERKMRKLGCGKKDSYTLDEIEEIFAHLYSGNENKIIELTEQKIKNELEIGALRELVEKLQNENAKLLEKDSVLSDKMKEFDQNRSKLLIDSILNKKIELKSDDTQSIWATPNTKEATECERKIRADFSKKSVELLESYIEALNSVPSTFCIGRESINNSVAVTDGDQTELGTKVTTNENSGGSKRDKLSIGRGYVNSRWIKK